MKRRPRAWLPLLLIPLAAFPLSRMPGQWPPMPWDPGSEHCTAASKRTESRAWDATTVVIRENPCVDPEANLVYLLMGSERALLVDSGPESHADQAPLAAAVMQALQDAGRRGLPLLVVHTHGHTDHRDGDAQFTGLPGVTIAPIESQALRRFFGFHDWPNGIAQIDLGGRIVDVIPSPGHHRDHVVFYDRNTQLLLSGDFLMPGRLLVDDLAAYRASAQRVAEFSAAHPVRFVLGAHIELDADGNPYDFGASYHPYERSLPLTSADLAALPVALQQFNGFYSRFPHFIVVNTMHVLAALAAGALLVVALIVWGARRWWKRRRARA
jgi:glyoxylase-like metal-dependent hydrolase (beta-lactamase superfamily II)